MLDKMDFWGIWFKVADFANFRGVRVLALPNVPNWGVRVLAYSNLPNWWGARFSFVQIS